MFKMIEAVSSKVMLGLIGILAGIIVVLGIYSYFTSSSLDRTKEKLTTAKAELEQKDKDIENIIEGYNATLELERTITKQRTITLEQKQEVIKSTSKVKEAVIKRGEIKQDEKADFIAIEL